MKHPKPIKYSIEQFQDAVAKSTSIRQCLSNLGIAAKGGNYRVFYRLSAAYEIDTSHFKGQGWNKNFKSGPKRPIEDYLSNKFLISSNGLKKRLLKEGLLKHQCHNCKLKLWLKNPIPLELHHVDGNHENNSLSNLQLLCPNCHTLTDSYRRKKNRINLKV